MIAPKSAEIGDMTAKIRRLKLLFLAYPFPPANINSCVRTSNLAKYLSRLGWDVTVLTPCPSVWRNVENSEDTTEQFQREGIRRILTGHGWRCLSPDHLNCWNRGMGWLVGGIARRIARQLRLEKEIGWIKAAERACSTIKPQDVDIILATASPFASFSLAKRLSNRLGRPYVLDYRDPWTGNPHASHFNHPAIIKKEASLLAGSGAVTIVSASWRRAMEEQFHVGSKLHVLTNGYDPEELADVKPCDFGHSAIVYAGNFYPPKRVITPVMAALASLNDTAITARHNWVFHYYGSQESHVLTEAQRFGTENRVINHGWVSRNEVLSAVRGAKVVVVITSVLNNAGMDDNGIMTGKIYDAMGLGTPVLLVAPPGSDAEAIPRTSGLGRSFSSNDVPGITSFLAHTLTGNAPKPKNLATYAWPGIIRRLDRILRNVIDRQRQTRCAALRE